MSSYYSLGLNYRQQHRYKDHIRKRDNYTCQLCGRPGYDVGHIKPFDISYDSTPSNLRVLCHPCNLRGRRFMPPKGMVTRVPFNQWEDYIRQELLNCANQ